MPGWLKTWLAIAAIAGFGALLVLGFLFFLAFLLAVLVPVGIWAWATGKLKRTGPVIVEGEIVREPQAAGQLLEHDQKSRLAATRVWVVWYEDPLGTERDSFGKAVCFSEADARAWVTRSGSHLLEPGFAGCRILGPENPLTTPLFREQRAEILGAILERLERGSAEPIPMRIV